MYIHTCVFVYAYICTHVYICENTFVTCFMSLAMAGPATHVFIHMDGISLGFENANILSWDHSVSRALLSNPSENEVGGGGDRGLKR